MRRERAGCLKSIWLENSPLLKMKELNICHTESFSQKGEKSLNNTEKKIERLLERRIQGTTKRCQTDSFLSGEGERETVVWAIFRRDLLRTPVSTINSSLEQPAGP